MGPRTESTRLSDVLQFANKANAVVDADFKVYGTTNLRVVDASVFPRIPGLFIVYPLYMLAEKAADTLIREFRG